MSQDTLKIIVWRMLKPIVSRDQDKINFSLSFSIPLPEEQLSQANTLEIIVWRMLKPIVSRDQDKINFSLSFSILLPEEQLA